MKVLKGKSVKAMGVVEGVALVSTDLIAYWAGTDWETGEIVEVGHSARGENVKGKILVYPSGKGGAGDTYGYYYLFRTNNAPKAMICNRANSLNIGASLLTNTPMIYGFDEDIVKAIKTGNHIRVDSDNGTVEILDD
jgi:predicted aconitase with swiveling domain